MSKHSKGTSHPSQLPGSDRETHKGKKDPRRGISFWKLFRRGQPVCLSSEPPNQTTLKKYLEKGEYPIFQAVPMFESNFFQVSRRGKHVFFHNHTNKAIVGIATTNVELPLPNVLFIARPVDGRFSLGPIPGEPILTRAIPLKFVRFSIHDPKKRVIKMRLINQRSYYLQLHAPRGEERGQFDRWLSLVYLLHHPPSCYLSSRPKSLIDVDNLSIDYISSDEGSVAAPFPEETDQNEEDSDEQRRSSIEAEEYTEEMQQILQTKPKDSRSTIDIMMKEDSFETYEPSIISKQSNSSDSFLSDLCLLASAESIPSALVAMTELPVYQEPEKEAKKSLNIISVYSAVSKTIAASKNAKKCN